MAKIKKKHLKAGLLVVLLLLFFVGLPLAIYFMVKSKNDNDASQAARIKEKLKTLPKVAGHCGDHKHCPDLYQCVSGVCVQCNSNDKNCTSRKSNVPPPAPVKPQKFGQSCLTDCDCPVGSACCGDPGGPKNCIGCDESCEIAGAEVDCCYARMRGDSSADMKKQCMQNCPTFNPKDPRNADYVLCINRCASMNTCPNCNGAPGGGGSGCYKCDSSHNCMEMDSCPAPGAHPGFEYTQGDASCSQLNYCAGADCDSNSDCGNGACSNGYCICNKGWTGRHCDQAVKKK